MTLLCCSWLVQLSERPVVAYDRSARNRERE